MDLGDAAEFAKFTYSDGQILFTFKIDNLISTNAIITITAQETVDDYRRVIKQIRIKIASENEIITETIESESGDGDSW